MFKLRGKQSPDQRTKRRKCTAGPPMGHTDGNGADDQYERMAVDEVTINEGGPLSVMYCNIPSGHPPQHTVHFLCTSGSRAGRTAGCNKLLKPARYTPIPDQHVWDEVCNECTICKFCAALYMVPRSWSLPLKQYLHDPCSAFASPDLNAMSDEIP